MNGQIGSVRLLPGMYPVSAPLIIARSDLTLCGSTGVKLVRAGPASEARGSTGPLVKIAASKLSDKEGLYIKRRKVFIQEAVEREEVEIIQIPSADNKADILTKILGAKPYRRLRDLLLNVTSIASNVASAAAHTLNSLFSRAS